jgi:hypothetical protein
VLIILFSFWFALSFWFDFQVDVRRADAASLPGGTRNAQVSVNILGFGVKFAQRKLARKGKKPQGNEEHSCLEASYPS